jgi:hypothetical protein
MLPFEQKTEVQAISLKSIYCLLTDKRNSSLVCLLTKKQMEVIRW